MDIGRLFLDDALKECVDNNRSCKAMVPARGTIGDLWNIWLTVECSDILDMLGTILSYKEYVISKLWRS